MKTILTGIRVNSIPTLGNFLGAILPMVRLANTHSHDHHINIFVPDLHTIIADVDGNLQQNLLTSIKYYLAAGLNLNENIHFYRQSFIPAHSELAWILSCITPVGELSRMTQFKEKGADQASVNTGILTYPILMAADILLYDAEIIPVGEDQFQHLELARHLATRFNRRYAPVFTVPVAAEAQMRFMSSDRGLRIRDLVDPTKKMSKSSPAENGKILLTDTPAIAAKKIRSATTDSFSSIKFDFFTQPGISNLLQIEALVTDRPLADIVGIWAGQSQYGELKSTVASHVELMLDRIQSRVAEISDADVIKLLLDGESYAMSVASAKLAAVQSAIHLR